MTPNSAILRPIPFLCALALFLTLLVTGCQTGGGGQSPAQDTVPPTLRLAAGDVVEVIFPGATNLSGMFRIGPEGTVTMPLVGPVQAVGKTADELQAKLLELYASELKENNILVSIAGSGNAVYLTGAVLRPGKIQLDRPLTALEAIMEVGGFAPTANKKKVTIVRYVDGKNTRIPLDLDPILSGGEVPQFYVRPKDIIHVPEKMQWF